MKLPMRIIFSAPSQAGKTYLLTRMLVFQDYCFDNKFDQILWSYGISQPKFFRELKKLIPGIQFYQGFPEKEILEESILKGARNGCIVLDDLVEDCEKSKALVQLFTKKSHHRNWSIFFTIQCLFWPSENIRICQRNATHLVLFNSPRDSLSVRTMVILLLFLLFC